MKTDWQNYDKVAVDRGNTLYTIAAASGSVQPIGIIANGTTWSLERALR